MADQKNLPPSNPTITARTGSMRPGGTALMTDADLGLHKPDWRYGQNLVPAHFQAQTRYVEHLVDAAVRSSFDLTWGITDLSLNVEALATGQVVIERMHAILPDGTPIVVGGPNANARVNARSFEPELRAKAGVDIYLGLVNEKPGERNVADAGEDASRARFVAAASETRDFNTGQDPVAVEWLCANLRLLSDGESRDDYTTIRVARLERTKTGAIEMAAEFAPPSLRLQAAPLLLQCVAAVKASLQTARAALLTQHGAERDASIPDAIRGFVLSTIGQFMPRMTRVLSSPAARPSDAFDVVAEVIGALSAYAPAGTATLPAYQHADPGPAFLALAAEARRILYWVGAPPYRALPLSRQDGGVWVAALTEPGLFAKEFLLIATGGDPNQLRAEISQLARVAPADELVRVSQAAIAGVKLVPETRRVHGVPVAPNSAAFRFDKNSSMWRNVVSKGSLAILLPATLAPHTELALFVEATAP